MSDSNEVELLRQLLSGSRYLGYLDVVPSGGQLPAFVAVVNGLKPAMDMWVRRSGWDALVELCRYFGVLWEVESYFNPDGSRLAKFRKELFTTTRAIHTYEFEQMSEAHVFVARSRTALELAINRGWYPLVVGDRVIEKHVADHLEFGRALGYPECCLEFFLHRNNWNIDSTFYAAYSNTRGVPVTASNGLLRHSAYSYISHMPCSFGCAITAQYSRGVRELLEDECTGYVQEIDRRLSSPCLTLNELQIFRFDGYLTAANEVVYRDAEAVSPTPKTSAMLSGLRSGNRCVIDGNFVYVYNSDGQVFGYFSRGDMHGPEIPFLVQCNG